MRLRPLKSNRRNGVLLLQHSHSVTLDEDPIPRRPRREVKITLPQSEDADKPFDMEVNVDRGVATYPYPLPENAPDAFINDDFKGWGESQNNKSSPAYVEVSATPSANVEVKNQGETLGTVNWGEVRRKREPFNPTNASR